MKFTAVIERTVVCREVITIETSDITTATYLARFKRWCAESAPRA